MDEDDREAFIKEYLSSESLPAYMQDKLMGKIVRSLGEESQDELKAILSDDVRNEKTLSDAGLVADIESHLDVMEDYGYGVIGRGLYVNAQRIKKLNETVPQVQRRLRRRIL